MLLLVRHAVPAHGPHLPPERWELTEAGHAAAAALRIPHRALLVSSLEPKARQTLEPSGSVATDARFNEIRRVEAYDESFRELRMAYIGGVDHDGWEPRAEVAARFDAGIAEWRRRAGDRPLVVASHGMAMTLWLDATVGLADPVAFWSALRMPDVIPVA